MKARSYSGLEIESRTSNFSIKVSSYVLPNIVGEMADCPQLVGGWGIPEVASSNLADPDFHHPRSVELLIGGFIKEIINEIGAYLWQPCNF